MVTALRRRNAFAFEQLQINKCRPRFDSLTRIIHAQIVQWHDGCRSLDSGNWIKSRRVHGPLCRSFLSEFRMQIASVSAPKSDQGLICIHISRFQVANCYLHSPLIRLTRWLDLLTDPVPTKHDLSILLGVLLKVNYVDQILTLHM